MWDPPGPGIEPMSPESAGGFFDTEPPGKPRDLCFNLLHAHDGVETEVSESLSKNSPLPHPPGELQRCELTSVLPVQSPSVCLSDLEHPNGPSQGLSEISQQNFAVRCTVASPWGPLNPKHFIISTGVGSHLNQYLGIHSPNPFSTASYSEDEIHAN